MNESNRLGEFHRFIDKSVLDECHLNKLSMDIVLAEMQRLSSFSLVDVSHNVHAHIYS